MNPIPARRDWMVAAAVILIVATHVTLPPVRNRNFRNTTESSWNLARAIRGIEPAGPPAATGDDQGPTLLMALTIVLAYSREELAALPALPRIPRLYFLALIATNALMLGVLFAAARRLWGRGAALGLIAIFSLGSNVRFLAFSGDVYMFPWYAGVLMLAAVALLDSKARGAAAALGACVLGIVVCSVFRSGAHLVGVGFALAALRPQWIAAGGVARLVRQRAIACLVALLSLYAARSVWVPQQHPLWHALHAGLLEFGGHRDAGGHIYPYFVPPGELPPGSEYVPRWGDRIMFDLATRTRPGVVIYSAEYEEIIKQDVLRVARDYPVGVIRLIGRRLWRLLILNPWQRVGPTSELRSHWSDTPLRIAWLTCVAVAFRRFRPRTLVAAVALAPLALPVLLVHSAYLMYNFPAHLLFYVLVVCAIATLLSKDVSAAPAT